MTEKVNLKPEEEERLRALCQRSDALNHGYAAVEDEEWTNPEMKARVLGALQEMHAEAEEEFRRYRSEVGIPNPLA